MPSSLSQKFTLLMAAMTTATAALATKAVDADDNGSYDAIVVSPNKAVGVDKPFTALIIPGATVSFDQAIARLAADNEKLKNAGLPHVRLLQNRVANKYKWDSESQSCTRKDANGNPNFDNQYGMNQWGEATLVYKFMAQVTGESCSQPDLTPAQRALYSIPSDARVLHEMVAGKNGKVACVSNNGDDSFPFTCAPDKTGPLALGVGLSAPSALYPAWNYGGGYHGYSNTNVVIGTYMPVLNGEAPKETIKSVRAIIMAP